MDKSWKFVVSQRDNDHYIFNIRVSLLAVRAYCRYTGNMLMMLMVLLYLILHDRHVCLLSVDSCYWICLLGNNWGADLAMQGSMKRTFKADLSWDNAWSYNVYNSIERFWELDTWWYMPIVNEYKGLQSISEPDCIQLCSFRHPSWFHDHLEVKNIMFHP